MNFFSSQAQESDDISVLPPSILPIYKNPYGAFGLDPASVTESNIVEYTHVLRDVLRRSCLNHSPFFSSQGKAKLTPFQVVLAYHILRKTINPSKTAKGLKAELETSHHLKNFAPTDILPLLKPLFGGTNGVCSLDYRAAKMFAVDCKGVKTVPAVNAFGMKIVYTFSVHYCMRLKTVEKDYDEILAFHHVLQSELITVPYFPELDVLGTVVNKSNAHGQKLAEYFMRIHNMAAEKGKFYPRLFRLLNIDFESVQSEEEGAIMAILDTPILPTQTVWHLIDENWLVKWRRFVMGRGPRRYLPPGPIDNRFLLQEAKKITHKTLEKAKHYRCVNYNAWRFLQIVHGGGPCIGRREDEIYSQKGMSYLQAVIFIQCLARKYIVRNLRAKLLMLQLSRSSAGREVLAEFTKIETTKAIEQKIREGEMERTTDRVGKAVLLTQTMWRKRKNLVPEENLQKIKKDQEVFARAKVNGAKGDNNTDDYVVIDTVPIVFIGNTNSYFVTLPEELGRIPFNTRRLMGSEVAIVTTISPSYALQISEDSKIISINSHPTSTLTYEQVKAKLSSALWPITLELERPMKEQAPTLWSLIAMDDPVLQYNAFKILLATGIKMMKHNSNNNGSHFTIIRISDKEFFYRGKFDPKKRENDIWHKFSLFHIKFILGPIHDKKHKKGAHESARVESRRSKLRATATFVVVTEDRELIFEIIDDEKIKSLVQKEEQYKSMTDASKLKDKQDYEKKMNHIVESHRRAYEASHPHASAHDYLTEQAKVFIRHMKALSNEVRESQIYVDKDGMPIKHTMAKASLRKLG